MRLQKYSSGEVLLFVEARRDVLVGLVQAAVAAVAFGSVPVFGKHAYRLGAEAHPVLATRYLMTAALVALVAFFSSRRVVTDVRIIVRLLLLGGVGALSASLFFAALRSTPVNTTALVFYTYPIWTNLLAFAVGLEPFRWKIAVSLALSIAGLLVIFSISGMGSVGSILALLSALVIAAYFVLAETVSRHADAVSAALWSATGAGLSLSAIWFVEGGKLPVAALLPATGLGLSTALGSVLFFGALERIGAARTSIALMLEPMAALVLAAVSLGEVITVKILTGAVLVLTPILVLGGSSQSKRWQASSLSTGTGKEKGPLVKS